MNLHLQESVYRIYTCRVHVVVVQTEDASRSRADSPSCVAACRGRKGHIGNDFVAFSIPISSARHGESSEATARGTLPNGTASAGRDGGHVLAELLLRGEGDVSVRARPRVGSRILSPPRRISRPLAWLPPSAPFRASRRLFARCPGTGREPPAASRRDHPAYRPEPSDDARLPPPRALPPLADRSLLGPTLHPRGGLGLTRPVCSKTTLRTKHTPNL